MSTLSRTAVILKDWVARLPVRLTRKSREPAAAHERFRGVFEQSGVAVVLADLDGRILETNPAFRRMVQHGDEELRGRSFFDLTHPDDREEELRRFEEALRSGREAGRRMRRCMRKDGGEVWVDLMTHLLRRTDGQAWMLAVVAVDMTRHRRIEDELRAGRQDYRQLFTAMENGFALHEMIADADGQAVDYRFVEVNPAFERLTGLSAERVVGRTVKEVMPNLDDFWIGLYGDVVRTGLPRHVEHFSTALNRWYEVHVYRPAPGRFATLFCDVTARREAEARHHRIETRARQTQKQESLGLLASGIAHDFNNLLVLILGHADLALADLSADASAHPHLTNIVKASRQAAELCRQMLAYSGRASFSVSRVDVNHMARDVARHKHESMGRNVDLHLEMDRESPWVDGDLEQLRQVVSNLLANAAEAIGQQRGRIVLRTGIEECGGGGPPRNTTGDPLPGGRYAFLEVADTGCGVEDAVLEKMFDPFFSTKAMGRGLGLATVLGAVRAHKGGIRTTSKVGQGTTVRVLLPLAAAPGVSPAAKAPASQTEPAVAGAILVIEPELAVRHAAVRILEGAGFHAVGAPSIGRAVDRLRDTPEQLAAALVDMDLLIDGAGEGLDRLLTLRQDLPVILSNGFTDEEARVRLGGAPVAGFIRKPYVSGQLIGRIREILTPAGSAAIAADGKRP